MRTAPSLAWLLALVGGGCTGVIGSGHEGNGPGLGVECTSTASPGAPVPMRRLTASQVQRTALDVLGVDVHLTVTDEKLFTFKSNVSSSVDFVGAHGYLDFAEAAVAEVDRSACAKDDDACHAWLYDDVGQRLFRRALTDDEQTRYDALFAAGSTADGPLEGARWVLEAMLQSPSLLYLDEVTKDDGYLDDYAIASRLALTLWGLNPDAELLSLAGQGSLSTPEQVRDQAERMLDDPRAIGGLTDFVDQWLRLERLDDPDARPDLVALGDEIVKSMREEPVQLFRMLLDEGSDVQTLLTTTHTVPLPLLASIYGADIVASSDTEVELDPTRRAGILSLPGPMAALAHAKATSPTLRGYAVLANFLCSPPSPPPAGVKATLPEIGPDKTTRERLEAHFSDPSCASCHKAMDGMGFAFEGIDWLGQSRDEEFGKPIDDTTSFPLDGAQASVEGPTELAKVLAESPSVASCVARQWASYGAGTPDKKETACLVAELATEARQPEGLRNMIIGFVTSDWYRRGPGDLP